ncbi:MAG: hypothetical protein U0165_07500 [Polyangiaceae bacterium]
MSRTALSVIVSTLFMMGCATPSSDGTPSTARAPARTSASSTSSSGSSAGETKPIPEKYAAEIARVQMVGQKIVQHDKWAWIATDLAADAGKLVRGKIAGWIIEEKGQGAIVHFYSPDDTPASVVRVVFPGQTESQGRLEDGALPLSPTMLEAVRAREVAQVTKFPQMTDAYNTVVLPGSVMGKEGWLVYMLAASKRQGEVIIGGHTRMHISSEGKVLQVTPLSRSILRMFPGRDLPKDAQSAGLFVTHIVSPLPVETYVYTSKTYKTDILIMTESGMWKASAAGNFSYVGDAPPERPLDFWRILPLALGYKNTQGRAACPSR